MEKNVKITAVDTELWMRLRVLALQHGTTLKATLRDAIAEYIERHK